MLANAQQHHCCAPAIAASHFQLAESKWRHARQPQLACQLDQYSKIEFVWRHQLCDAQSLVDCLEWQQGLRELGRWTNPATSTDRLFETPFRLRRQYVGRLPASEHPDR